MPDIAGAFTWGDVLKLALTTGIVTSAMSLGVGWLQESRREKAKTERDARYLALRLAVIFEKFAIYCADVIYDNGLADTSGGHAGTQHTRLPDLEGFPDDADWKALDGTLAGRALTFRVELLLSGKMLAELWVFSDPDEIAVECNEQAGLHGMRAWEIAHDLRARYLLSPFDPAKLAYDVTGTLRTHRDAALARRRGERDANRCPRSE
jgi:hypothetical protein